MGAGTTNRIGDFLRTRRREKGLTLEHVARLAGIGRVTLNRWETGVHLPREKELQSVLTVLEVEARQKRRVAAMENEARARSLVREEAARISNLLGIASRPHGGDLLLAMRTRRGMSREQAAEHTGVTVRTLRLWEKAEVWPSVETLHRLCYRLHAHESEMIALTCYHLTLLPTGEQPSIEELHHQLMELMHSERQGSLPQDLEFLALEAKAWKWAAKDEAGRRLLAKVCVCYSMYLERTERPEMMGAWAERALQLSPQDTQAERILLHASVFASVAPAWKKSVRASRKALPQLYDLLPLGRKHESEAWICSNIAEALVNIGEGDSALAMSKKACQLAEQSSSSENIWLRRMMYSSTLLEVGRGEEALACVPLDHEPSPYHRSVILRICAQAHLQAGRFCEAHDAVQKLLQLTADYSLGEVRLQAEELARQF